MLGEAAWKVMLTPGPLRAFFERVRARRGPQVAATATARKLVVLFWHLLTREQDYEGRKGVAGNKSKQLFEAERELSRQAETAYRRLVSDWRSSGPPRAGAGVTPGRASSWPSKGKAARQTP
jgi:transposase